MDAQIEIEHVDIDTLKPALYNPRKISDAELKKLTRSIKQFGFIDPVIINKDNTVIGGHQRLKVADELGLKTVPVVRVDLSENDAKLLNLALNKIGGDWDEDKLTTLLTELKEADVDVLLSGFDADAISELLDAGKGVVEVAPPEPPTEPMSKRGEVYQLGRHRLMCGDATSEEDVAKLMGGAKADMVLTDPPYGVDYAGKNKYLNVITPANRIETPIVNDNIKDYDTFFLGFLKALKGVVEEYNTFYITISGQKLLCLLNQLERCEYYTSQILVWVKNNHVLGRQDYSNKHELIVYGWVSKHKFYGGFDTTVWEIPKPQVSPLHPTMKPIELCAKAIKNSTLSGMKVLDVFGGSGTTLIACEQLNRTCYMMEIDPAYCDVIRERYERCADDTT